MLKILLVDDEPLILKGLSRIIEREDNLKAKVLCAESAAEAMELSAEFRPNVVLVDINMPEMNGLQLIEKLKKRNIADRFIVLTGYDDFEYVRTALRLNVQDYLMKPINKELLLKNLHSCALKKEFEIREMREARLAVLRTHFFQSQFPDQISLSKRELMELFPAEFILVTVFRSVSPFPPAIISEIEGQLLRLFKTKYTFFSDNREELVLIVNWDGEISEEIIADTLNALVLKLSESSIMSIQSGISYAGRDINTVKDLYTNAVNSCDLESFFRESSVESPIMFGIPLEKLRELMKSDVRNRRTHSQLMAYQRELLARNSGEKKGLSSILRQLSGDLKTELESCSCSPEQLFYKKIYYSESDHFIFLNRNIRFLIESLKSTLILYDEMVEYDIKGVSSHIQKILLFIHENYDKDLCLDCLALEFNLHPNYISDLFRKEAGSSFLKYLNVFRIEKAKDIINKNSMLSFEEVAEKAGYSNSRYFYRVFKKYSGITPGQYRRKVKNEV
ncbi:MULTISPECIES: response regulator [unclassified Oceanispirochaeta]|uniref:response regulator transcription factor n=1 Tax=unclassified Oceanispirochaeta TaxID=2635722 RepID=UPI000E0971B8|nr:MULTISPECIES: response regulator [unclassified Oceanispirochaeta]MBF9016509.1 response regulator [Oceanispirochaeta sp. M2]NPD72971.1 response regulator [Oceanispirochaeta sp. M1]RDG31314.1 response regulator [Oceanispirochaeta sp. M1]